MGKGKRNRDRNRRPPADLRSAQERVREAEEGLLAARQAANTAAALRGVEARTRHKLVKRSYMPVDLDTGTEAPEDQASAFFNRPGDYFLARFTIGGHVDATAGVNFEAETVLKASEDQFDYLLEVLRQIRGGFGDHCRIELYRTHTREAPTPPTLAEVKAAAEAAVNAAYAPATIADGPPVDMSEVTLGERYGSAEAGHDPPNGQIPPWMADPAQIRRRLGLPERDVYDQTRAELAAQLPGRTRAEVAYELDLDPATLGEVIEHTDLTREQIADELGVSVEDVTPLPMRGGGLAYSIKPAARKPDGRHAAGEIDNVESVRFTHEPEVCLAHLDADCKVCPDIDDLWAHPRDIPQHRAKVRISTSQGIVIECACGETFTDRDGRFVDNADTLHQAHREEFTP